MRLFAAAGAGRCLLISIVVVTCLFSTVSVVTVTSTEAVTIKHPILRDETPLAALARLTGDLLHLVRIRHCVCIVTDDQHYPVFGAAQFAATGAAASVLLVRIADAADTLRPPPDVERTLRAARRAGCDAYFIYLANGIQTERLMRYADRQRAFGQSARLVMLHDYRLFAGELHFLWRRFVRVLFVRQYERVVGGVRTGRRGHNDDDDDNVGKVAATDVWFELSTVPFPQPIRAVFVPLRLAFWHPERPSRLSGSQLFADRTANLAGVRLRAVVLQHTPAVRAHIVDGGRLTASRTTYTGVEVEILDAVADALNFTAELYETADAAAERWGRVPSDNGTDGEAATTATGILGEMIAGRADFALADLAYTPYDLEYMDLSAPYATQCMTFMTPESLTDNSWQTLVLPFSAGMWAGVGGALAAIVVVFYAMSRVHLSLRRTEARLIRRRLRAAGRPPPQRAARLRVYKTPRVPGRPLAVTIRCRWLPKEECPAGLVDLDLFDTLGACVLYAYSMLMLVSLPRLPRSWSVRVLTGWYWTYCILVVVAYRASLTAILANPAPKLTIDTIRELAHSPIECGAWGDQTRLFFAAAADEASRRIGAKLESTVGSTAEDAVQRVSDGRFAFYESTEVLQEQRSRRSAAAQTPAAVAAVDALHIMQECAINMPIAVGMERNSPLRARVDALLRRLIEAGLTGKWLAEARREYAASSVEEEPQEALMELRKLYGALVALAVGWAVAAVAAGGELLWWRWVVRRRVGFDRYAMGRYYEEERRRRGGEAGE